MWILTLSVSCLGFLASMFVIMLVEPSTDEIGTETREYKDKQKTFAFIGLAALSQFFWVMFQPRHPASDLQFPMLTGFFLLGAVYVEIDFLRAKRRGNRSADGNG